MKFALAALGLLSSLVAVSASDADELKTLVSELTVAATQSERLAILDEDKDFVFDFLNAAKIQGAVGKGNGGQAVSAKTTTFPALIGNSLAMTVGFLGPCAQNTPHIHPRSAEMLIMVAGDTINTGTFQENGARFVENKIEVGQATVFQMGSIHFQQNLGCDPAIFVAGFANEDPGTLQIAQGFFQQLPPDTTSATLGELGVEEVQDISKKIPANIAFGVAECVKRCKIDRNSTFEFSEQVISKALKEQGILATIASGSASSRVNTTSNKQTSNLSASSSNSGASNNATVGDDNNDSFWNNKYHVLVIVLAVACGVLVLALVAAIGVFARVGGHEEIEELAEHSPIPIINALSSLWHPTQILADILTLHEHAHLFGGVSKSSSDSDLTPLRPLTVTWLGDSSNVLHDILVALPRLGHQVRVGTPPQQAYQCPKPVWDRVKELGCDKNIVWTDNPYEAVKGADVVITDTWISMGQEAEKAQRLKDFQGYQVTEKLCKEGGANPDWKFMHCLPRKSNEVDDQVFYGPRSLVFPEAENRKWTIMALFE
ncbi:ornithine carbamoyltransferase [Ceratobasidium sp. 423]|nr:ornithine carbamoyltransferase [Ceratobasidium sp. 423]